MATIEVEMDSRHRLPLAKLKGKHTRYQVKELSGGDLLLTPVESISARELATLRNPELLADIKEGLQQMADGETVAAPDDLFDGIDDED